MADERRTLRQTYRRFQAVTGRRISPQFVQHLLDAQRRERIQITAEIVKVKGLMPLLMRRRNGGYWSSSERKELSDQLQALIHLSPYVVILALPGSFLVLPVLAWWLDRRRIQRGSPSLRPRP